MYPQRSVMTCGLATALEPPHFNPRTRVGCDLRLSRLRRTDGQFQSTHPRGVRQVGLDSKPQRIQVSIHAPAWGATSSSPAWRKGWFSFNPRTRVGCDVQIAADQVRREAGFNPRTRVGCDIAAIVILAFTCGFNPRTRVGCDEASRCQGRRTASFNPRTRVGCDHRCRPCPPWGQKFQSTHPRGVRRMSWRPCSVLRQRFNPRTRVGCDGLVFDSLKVSVSVSIHAPAWGATSGFYLSCHLPKGFNPRTRVGCDGFAAVGRAHGAQVSIHAPAWGATRRLVADEARQQDVSIHAPAWGATSAQARAARAGFWFQSTHPRGVRHCPPWHNRWSCAGFNPRTRVGCDILGEHGARGVADVSIHAPAWGATRQGLTIKPVRRMFQSTHPRGVRQVVPSIRKTGRYVSIHAPAWGATVSMFYPVDSRD